MFLVKVVPVETWNSTFSSVAGINLGINRSRFRDFLDAYRCDLTSCFYMVSTSNITI